MVADAACRGGFAERLWLYDLEIVVAEALGDYKDTYSVKWSVEWQQILMASCSLMANFFSELRAARR